MLEDVRVCEMVGFGREFQAGVVNGPLGHLVDGTPHKTVFELVKVSRPRNVRLGQAAPSPLAPRDHGRGDGVGGSACRP